MLIRTVHLRIGYICGRHWIRYLRGTGLRTTCKVCKPLWMADYLKYTVLGFYWKLGMPVVIFADALDSELGLRLWCGTEWSREMKWEPGAQIPAHPLPLAQGLTSLLEKGCLPWLALPNKTSWCVQRVSFYNPVITSFSLPLGIFAPLVNLIETINKAETYLEEGE